MYHVTDWDTREIIKSVEKLSIGKRLTRQQGHVGLGNGKYWAPVAYLADDDGYCVYNPVFLIGKHDHLERK